MDRARQQRRQPDHRLQDHPLHRRQRPDRDDDRHHRDLGRRQRPHQRHRLHLHGDGDQRGRTGPRIGEIERGHAGGVLQHDLRHRDALAGRLRRRSSVELGVKFQSDIAGTINGIRFYKAAANTGTHVGSLWSATGTLLAQATFTGETASGWQQVSFSSPVSIQANTTYVAGYLAPNGHYSITEFALNRPPVDPASSTTRRCTSCADAGSGNGVYQYGASPVFPTNTYQSVELLGRRAVRAHRAATRRPAPDQRQRQRRARPATVEWTAPASDGGARSPATRSPPTSAPAPRPRSRSAPPATSNDDHRPHRRHHLHLHGDRDQRGRAGPRIGALQRGHPDRRQPRPAPRPTSAPAPRTPAPSWNGPHRRATAAARSPATRSPPTSAPAPRPRRRPRHRRDLGRRQRPDQRHRLHLHGDGDQRGRAGPRVGAHPTPSPRRRQPRPAPRPTSAPAPRAPAPSWNGPHRPATAAARSPATRSPPTSAPAPRPRRRPPPPRPRPPSAA